jgi:hypothetical protein
LDSPHVNFLPVTSIRVRAKRDRQLQPGWVAANAGWTAALRRTGTRREFERVGMALNNNCKQECDGRRSFRKVLSEWLTASGLEAKRVAADLGVSRATLSYWCDGSRFPSLDNLQSIANYTGIPLCHLICDKANCCHWLSVAERAPLTRPVAEASRRD